ncbi:hypothetical protein AVEN_210336-1, partial [Araneus ventricosus]
IGSWGRVSGNKNKRFVSVWNLSITVFSPDVKKIEETQDGKEIMPDLPLTDNQASPLAGKTFYFSISDIRLLHQEKSPRWSLERFVLKRQLLLLIWRG